MKKAKFLSILLLAFTGVIIALSNSSASAEDSIQEIHTTTEITQTSTIDSQTFTQTTTTFNTSVTSTTTTDIQTTATTTTLPYTEPHLKQLDDRSACLVDDNGKILTGWRTINGKRLYFSPEKSEIVKNEIFDLHNEKFSCNDIGEKVTGWQSEDEEKYYFRLNGQAVNDQFYNIENNTYYFSKDSLMQTGFIDVDDSKYYLDTEGKLKKGWFQINGEKYRSTSEEGKLLVSAWFDEGKFKYRTDENGKLKTGRFDEVGRKYYGDDNGVALRWRDIDGDTYYFGNDGVMRTFWGLAGSEWHYFGNDGKQNKNYKIINGVKYYVDGSGGIENSLSLCSYVLSKVGCPYWMGASGQIANANLLASLRSSSPYYYRWTDFETQFGRQVFDCSGLICSFLRSIGRLHGRPLARTFYNISSPRGNMSSFPNKVGTLVYINERYIHHVGIYVGNDMIVEAKGHEWGVIVSKLSTNHDWNLWSDCPWIKNLNIRG